MRQPLTNCGHCHTCGTTLDMVLDGEEWCPNCNQYRRYRSHGWTLTGSDLQPCTIMPMITCPADFTPSAWSEPQLTMILNGKEPKLLGQALWPDADDTTKIYFGSRLFDVLRNLRNAKYYERMGKELPVRTYLAVVQDQLDRLPDWVQSLWK